MKILHSYRTILNKEIKESYVWIENGKITDITYSSPTTNINCIEELGNLVLMPGVIDPHVHINEPGRTEWEGFDTATKAAIAGGITSMVDMPLNSSPVTTTAEAFQQKIAATKNQLHTNIGLYGGIIPGNLNEIEGLIQAGVLGFKAFLTHSGIDDFPNASEDDLGNAMPILAKHRLPLLVHCEWSDDIIRAKGDPRSYQNYLSSRPRQWEDDAIAMMIRLCERHQCAVHVVHLSSSNAIPMLKSAKAKGLPITVETGQHYLYFNAETIPDGRTEYKCAPPIREKENNEQLWKALKDGLIDFVATDHSPATPTLKELESGNLMKAWGGIASIQLALPVLWTAAERRGFELSDLVRWLCTNPAHLIGKNESKGAIAVGMDADFAVLDPEATFQVDGNQLHHRHKITPYHGEILKGVVKQTWLSGEKVYADNQFLQLNKGQILFRNK
ncbi:MAG: allantoinase AllB [Bacteroidetes bacterium]|nr:allantoinase AllB [Bacteroidota bacterium]